MQTNPAFLHWTPLQSGFSWRAVTRRFHKPLLVHNYSLGFNPDRTYCFPELTVGSYRKETV